MSRPVLFLDIDGVINVRGDHETGRALIRPACAATLHRVLATTGAIVVLSSSWRYQVLLGAMTARGFEHLLRSHGIAAQVVDVTAPDDAAQAASFATCGRHRGQQIREWLAERPHVTRWAVVDDVDVDVGPLVRTDPAVGLTPADGDRLVDLLGVPGVAPDPRDIPSGRIASGWCVLCGGRVLATCPGPCVRECICIRPIEGPRDEWVILCRASHVSRDGLAVWWRAGGNGYTHNLDDAGLWTEESARSQAGDRDLPVPLEHARRGAWVCVDRGRLGWPGAKETRT